MFSDPNIVEWISGAILMISLLGIIVIVSFLIALTVIRIFGDQEFQYQADQRTLDTTTVPEKKRTAA